MNKLERKEIEQLASRINISPLDVINDVRYKEHAIYKMFHSLTDYTIEHRDKLPIELKEYIDENTGEHVMELSLYVISRDKLFKFLKYEAEHFRG